VSSSSPTTQPTPQRKMNVYTFMLIVSFVAISLGAILLFTELMKYGSYPWWSTSGS
jgi:hypothetical protein